MRAIIRNYMLNDKTLKVIKICNNTYQLKFGKEKLILMYCNIFKQIELYNQCEFEKQNSKKLIFDTYLTKLNIDNVINVFKDILNKLWN